MPSIELNNVSVAFPIYSAGSRSLKKAMLAATTGGRIGNDSNHVVIQALDRCRCSFSDGDRVALIGHNGAGKTTLLRVLAGIYEPRVGIGAGRWPRDADVRHQSRHRSGKHRLREHHPARALSRADAGRNHGAARQRRGVHRARAVPRLSGADLFGRHAGAARLRDGDLHRAGNPAARRRHRRGRRRASSRRRTSGSISFITEGRHPGAGVALDRPGAAGCATRRS